MSTLWQLKQINIKIYNRFTREQPAVQDIQNYRRQVFSSCYSFVDSRPVSSPELVAFPKEEVQLT